MRDRELDGEHAAAMPTYREHDQVIRMIRELADLLDRQSRQITRISRQRQLGDDLPDASALRDTWHYLGMAFRLLAAHAQSVQSEFARLEAEFAGDTSS